MPYTPEVWVDEVLPAPATYTISGTGAGQTIVLDQTPTQAGTSVVAAKMNNIESFLDTVGDIVLISETATVVGSNETGVVGELAVLTIAGMTANRFFNLPTPSAAGEVCGVLIVDDAPNAPTKYELVVRANAVEITRLLIAGESLVFRSTGAGAADWVIAEGGDRRVANVCIIRETSATTVANASQVDLLFDGIVEDNAYLEEVATNSIVCRRPGFYNIFLHLQFDVLPACTRIDASILLNAGVEHRSQSQSYAGLVSVDCFKPDVELAINDLLTAQCYQNGGSPEATLIGSSRNSFLSVEEILQ